MTLLYLLCGLLAALAFYLATAHQHLLPSLRPRARLLRVAAWLLSLGSLLAAMQALGLWAGVFASLSMAMLGMALLPYLDAWLQARGTRHVG
ncbi:hypothetical protein [Pseudoxanthomonas sp.]|uniref:hypothetical protein n=1 Tax=Pseudoxanthomonas sp. TaxID=1871049 RepID=UPI002625BCB8|nr:hypothetical protein [Pseudoxanthomonas sp.]WDS34789.1 MAG: hypothetical protein O8I58_10360 [Pseudoxanthomonas sp.]